MKYISVTESPEALTNLLGAEGADTVQSEAKQHALFLAHTDVESVVLHSHRAAFPTVTGRDCGTNERTISLPGAGLIVKEERRTTEGSGFRVAQKDGRTPLRATKRTWFLAARVRELGETRHQFDRARVVKSLECLKQRPVDSKRGGKRSQAATATVEIRAHVDKQIRARTIACLDVHRRTSSRHA